ncbi:MAG: Omp28-related outer membrane protein [Bacteroidetes bacterium]|nr:Omp28-related outer membrane protein [Bacteroidota bacterium]
MKYGMKKIYLAAFVVISAFALSSCSKDTAKDSGTNSNNDAVPSSFTQKVVVEEFTGAWCGYCIDGAYRLGNIVSANENAIGVSIHYGDGMQIAAYTDYKNAFTISGFPSGMVGRLPAMEDNKTVVMNRGWWADNATDQLKNTAPCGLKIDAQSTDAIKVTAGFNQEIQGDLRLTVMVIEDKVTGKGSAYDQHNYYSKDYPNNDPNNPFYNLPSVVTGYEHNHVLRKVLSSQTMGDVIDASAIKAGGKFEKSFSFDASSMNGANVKIVAFVNVVGSNAQSHKILNAQEVKLGASQGWD